jgi:hypothetical protein
MSERVKVVITPQTSRWHSERYGQWFMCQAPGCSGWTGIAEFTSYCPDCGAEVEWNLKADDGYGFFGFAGR